MVGQGSGIDGNRENSGSYSGTYTERSIFNDYRLVGLDAGFFKCHKIRLRIRFAIFHIEGSHHQFTFEDVGKMMVELVKERQLPRSGHYHRNQACLLDFNEHFVGSRHTFSFGEAVENITFRLIDALYFFFIGFVTTFALADDVYGGSSGTSFVHISFFAAQFHSILLHGFMPGSGMVFHGVEKHPVHIEKYGFQIDLAVAVCLKIIGNCCIHWI